MSYLVNIWRLSISWIISLGSTKKLLTHDKANSLITTSYKMVFYFETNHTKSVWFIIGYYYARFTFLRDTREWVLSMSRLKSHVWKLTFVEGPVYIQDMIASDKTLAAKETCHKTSIQYGSFIKSKFTITYVERNQTSLRLISIIGFSFL